jgi:hypothetical protein
VKESNWSYAFRNSSLGTTNRFNPLSSSHLPLLLFVELCKPPDLLYSYFFTYSFCVSSFQKNVGFFLCVMRIFRSEREEITRGRREVHNEDNQFIYTYICIFFTRYFRYNEIVWGLVSRACSRRGRWEIQSFCHKTKKEWTLRE